MRDRTTSCNTAGCGVGMVREELPTALALAGFTPYWFLLRRPALFYSLAGHSDTTVAAVGWYLFFLACTVAVVLAVVALAPRAARARAASLRRRATAALLALFPVQAVLKALEVLVPLTGLGGFAVAAADTALYAVALAVLTYLWTAWCVGAGPRRAALVAIGSFTLSFFVKMVGLLPEPAATVASAALPSLSAACWLAATAGGRRPIWSSFAAGGGVGSIRGPVRRVVEVLVALLLVGGVFRGVAFGMVSGGPFDPSFSPQDAISLAVSVLVLVYYLAHASMLRLPWFVMPLSMAVFFAGLLLMVVFADDQPAIGGSVVVVGRTSLSLLLWIVLVDTVRGEGLSAARVFGILFILVDVASSLLGYVLVPLAVSFLGFSLDGMAAVLAALVAFVLMTVAVMLVGRSLGAAWDPVGNPEGPAGELPAGGVPATVPPAPTADPGWFAAFNLTEREAEVARLLAEGNSQKKVAELLGVSMGTVQSHVKGVYRKLGIHSRQELIDLAHGEGPGPQAGL